MTKSPAKQNLAEYIKAKRKARGLTLRQIADRSEGLVSHSGISDIERGRSKNAKSETLRGLALGLGVSEAEIFEVVYATATAPLHNAVLRALVESFEGLKPKDQRALMPLIEMVQNEINKRL